MLDKNLAVDRYVRQLVLRDTLIHRLYSLIIALGLIIIVLAAMILVMTRSAAAESVCLSKKEARVLWPKAHIYWYSKNHCWSNRRGPPTGIKVDPVLKTLAQAPILPAPTYDVLPRPRPDEDYCCWPPLETLVTVEELRDHGLRLLAERMRGQ